MDVSTDIDIDFFDRGPALDGLTHVMASESMRKRHPTGVYFHDIPVDPIDGLAVWEYQEAEQRGYFKFDFLHNTIYRGVRDEAHLLRLLADPPWELFDDPDIVASLAHLSRHYAVVKSIQPRNVADLAVCIALIRPGKAHLIGRPRAEIDQEIWRKTQGFYSFKRAHAISFAASIVVQLNLLIEQAWSAVDDVQPDR